MNKQFFSFILCLFTIGPAFANEVDIVKDTPLNKSKIKSAEEISRCNVDELYKSGLNLAKQKEFSKAILIFKEVLRQLSRSTSQDGLSRHMVLMKIARTYSSDEKNKLAKKFALLAAEDKSATAKERGKSYLFIADTSYGLKDGYTAFESYKKAFTLDPSLGKSKMYKERFKKLMHPDGFQNL